MPLHNKAPATPHRRGPWDAVHSAKQNNPLDAPSVSHFQARSARRQRLVAHLHAAGHRSCLEALLEVACGRDLDEALESFGRIPVEIYRTLGADLLSVDQLKVVAGGKK